MSIKAFSDFKSKQKGRPIAKSFIYGNIARYFETPREDGHTHKWTVFVRPYEDEDVSAYVKKINFKLHGSFEHPSRSISRPPYQVTETGYGEFDIVIKIHFNDPNVKPLILNYFLRLHHNDPEIISGRKNLVNEIYDEMVFQNPSPAMKMMLSQSKPIHPKENDFEKEKHDQLSVIQTTSKTITQLIQQMGEQLKQKQEEIRNYKRAMGMLDETEL